MIGAAITAAAVCEWWLGCLRLDEDIRTTTIKSRQ